MANTLGAVLTGLNNGINTGLTLYRTVQDEARQKRQEERQARLDQFQFDRTKVEDERWQMGWDRQAERDKVTDARWQQEHDLRVRGQEFQEKEAARRAAAEERRHQEAMALARARLQATQQSARAQANSQYQKMLDGFVGDLKTAVKGDESLNSLGVMLNSQPTYRAALASRLGMDLSPDDLRDVQAINTEQGLLIAKRTPDGSYEPWDPDGDGQAGVMIPRNTILSIFGGEAGAAAVGADIAAGQSRRTLSDAAEAGARAQIGQAQQELAEQQARVEQARQRLDALQNSEQAQALAKDEARQQPFDGSGGYDGSLAWVATGAALELRRRALDAELARAQGEVDAAQTDVAVTQRRIKDLEQQPERLRQAYNATLEQIGRMPASQRGVAIQNAQEVIQHDPYLAARFPGKSLAEATRLAQEETAEVVNDIVGSINFKALSGDNDQASADMRASLQAVLENSTPEVRAILADASSNIKGAVRKAAVDAVRTGHPEAVPYILAADHQGLDSQQAVKLMQDKTLAQVKDDGARFSIAVEAMQMVKRGEAKSPEAALGMILGGMK